MIKWETKGHLKIPRTSCQVAAISKNSVIVIGGYGYNQNKGYPQAITSCEIVNTRTFDVEPSNPTNEPHAEAVLVQRGDSNLVILSGVGNNGSLTPVCEYYDRELKSWSIIGKLRFARKKHQATFIDNEQILIVGGTDSRNQPIRATEILNIKTKQSQVVTTFPLELTPFICAVSILSSYGKAIAIIGNDAQISHAGIYNFEEKHRQWYYLSSYPFPLKFPSMTRLLDYRLMVISSVANGHHKPDNLETIICIETLSGFKKVGSLLHPRIESSPIQWNADSVLVLCGKDKNGSIIQDTEWFDISSGKSSLGPKIVEPRLLYASISFPAFDDYGRQYQSKILMLGGKNVHGHFLSSIEVLEQTFDINTWDSNVQSQSKIIIWQWLSPTLLLTFIIGLMILALILVYLVNSLQHQAVIGDRYQRIRHENEQILFHSIELQLEKEQAQTKAINLQLQTLHLQLNPHFIFNSLSALDSLIIQQETDKASYYIGVFSRLLRNILQNSDNASVALHEEIQFLREYIALEQLRSGHTFDYIINHSSVLPYQHFHIPGMLIQPYVENAIKYGLGLLQDYNYQFPHQARKGILSVSFFYSEENQGSILCVIEDNGVGRKYAQENVKVSQGLSISTKVNAERLALLDSLNIQPLSVQYYDLFFANKETPAGTRVTLFLPIIAIEN